jgi:hypothetical protein
MRGADADFVRDTRVVPLIHLATGINADVVISIEAIWLRSWSERGPKRRARDHEHEMLAQVEVVGTLF